FLPRHHLSFRVKTRQGQTGPSNASTVAKNFLVDVLAKMAALDIDVLYKADHKSVFFGLITTSTIQKKGNKAVWIHLSGRDKEHLTCMLLGSSHGEKKIIFLVLKTTPSKKSATAAINPRQPRFGKRLWKDIKRLQDTSSGRYTATPAATISLAFFHYQFGDRSDMSKPVLFLLDDFSAH
ncbi:putative HTH CENPB-type domain-containing protein, partial [Phytophthora infestans]